MTFGYLLIAAILFSCILADRFSGKFGMPALILFMAVGMIFGCDGLFKIQFDNYGVAEKVCAAALVFIMFYGGFNTKWQSAKCVAVRATILSTLGVLVTAGLTGVFCYFVLHFSYVESFLIGAVLSSTDAASVFSILRGKHLNLRDGTASLLEIESGSNDPMSYLLTMIGISLLGNADTGNIPLMIFILSFSSIKKESAIAPEQAFIPIFRIPILLGNRATELIFVLQPVQSLAIFRILTRLTQILKPKWIR